VLKLSAEDAADLEVISAHMQDALVRVADMKYLRKQHQFAFLSNRFAWEAPGEPQRRRSGVHCNQALSVKKMGLERAGADTVLSLLSISFAPGETPSGVVTFTFSAGMSIQVHVEYLDLHVRDLGPSWGARHTPSHDA
jgi:Protein of unknown function (DUF2948)